jgi:transcription termination/antitermination protein NusA
MARKRKDTGKNLELIDALATLERDRGMPADTLFKALEDALGAAYPKTPGVTATHARIEIDRETGEFKVFELEVDEETEEVLSEAYVETPPELGRIAAQTAKQVIHQRLREAEREMAFEEYEDREGEIVTGIVEQHDPRFAILSLGKAEAIMPASEQVPRERYEVGDRVRAYITEVRKAVKGPTIVVSRTHPGLVRKLFEMEVPEIGDGLVEIKAIAREAGHRTKLAVTSNDGNIDPVGACVGPKGTRVRGVVNELRGEKIDIVGYAEDTSRFVADALSPARVRDVIVDEASKTATVVVPDNQLSLAIGKEGQNARLAARLTGWRIDIKSESQYAAGAERDPGPVFEPTVPERKRPRPEGEEAQAPTDAAPEAEASADAAPEQAAAEVEAAEAAPVDGDPAPAEATVSQADGSAQDGPTVEAEPSAPVEAAPSAPVEAGPAEPVEAAAEESSS